MSLYIVELSVSLCFVNNGQYVYVPYFNVTSGGIRCNKGTPIIKIIQLLPFYQRRNNERRKKSLDIEQTYGHGSQRGSMLGVTVLAGCRQ
jgi:hypothetical protein